jgi:hypothetical protein
MQLARFESAVPASERPQTDALGLAATGTGYESNTFVKYVFFVKVKFSCYRPKVA